MTSRDGIVSLARGVVAAPIGDGRALLSRMAADRIVAEPLVPDVVLAADGTQTSDQLARARGGSDVHVAARAYFTIDTLVRERWLALSAAPVEVPTTVAPFVELSAGSPRAFLTWDLLDPRIDATVAATDTDAIWPIVDAAEGLWIAPVVGRGAERACWACITHWMSHARPHAASVRRQWRPPHAHPSKEQVSALRDRVAPFAAESMAGGDAWTIVQVAGDGSVRARHLTRRRPDCPQCRHSRAPDGDGVPAFVGRAIAIDEALDPVTGLIHAVRVLRAPDADVAVGWVTGAPPRDGEPPFTALVCGTGDDPHSARSSLVYEALERHSTFWRPTDAGHIASLADLGDAAIAPNEIMGFSASQRADVDADAGAGQPHHAPEPLPAGEALRWSAVSSLTHQRVRHIPTGICYFAAPEGREQRWLRADSNGCAAGATVDDATARALLELIERDAAGIWWHSRARRPAAPTSWLGADWPIRTALWHAAGRDVWVLDLTVDTHVPVCAAISCDSEPPCARIAIGFGAGLTPGDAVRGAMREMSQTYAIVGDLSPTPGALSAPLMEWWQHASVAALPWLKPSGTAAAITPATPAGAESDDARVRWLRDRIEALGLECLRLDLTRADIGVPVVRTIVPGLQSLRRRLGHARWRTVPQRLGWIDATLAEDDANPQEMPF